MLQCAAEANCGIVKDGEFGWARFSWAQVRLPAFSLWPESASALRETEIAKVRHLVLLSLRIAGSLAVAATSQILAA